MLQPSKLKQAPLIDEFICDIVLDVYIELPWDIKETAGDVTPILESVVFRSMSNTHHVSEIKEF